ncbi:acyltransferase family protein [Microbacterium bovistercoris]|nr:acyltransferase [Microbacterium bovistercoris]
MSIHDTAARPAPAISEYVPALDGIRAIAVLAVFLLHLAAAYFPGGAVGVDLFFVLSAFLITGLLIAEFEASGRVRFGAFYLRRAFRLLPALVLWLMLASVTAMLAGEGEKVPWSVTGALFYFNDFLQAWTDWVATAFDQSWSLSVEEQFYFVWPPLLVLVLLHRSRAFQRWFMHVSVLAAAVVPFTGPNYFLPTGHLLPLVIGCWAAEQRARGCTPWVAALVRQAWVGYAACAVFVVATLFVVPKLQSVTFIAVSVATAALALRITTGRADAVTRVLGSRVPVWIGARSYGIYLYGLTLMQLVPLLIPGIELKWAAPIDVALTAVVVAASYRFVESPIRRRGRDWLRNRASRTLPDAA